MIKTIWRKITFFLLLTWCLLLVLVGARFAQHNPDLISLDLLLWQLPPLSSGLLMTLTLLLGVLLGALMILPLLVIARARLRRLRIQMEKVQSPPSPTAPMLKSHA